MKTSPLHPVTPVSALPAEPTEEHEGQAPDLPDFPDLTAATATIAADRRVQALEHAWELGEQRFTAEDCSVMSVRRLRRLCDEVFTALDSDFPEWGARDEYDMLSAEITARAKARNHRSASVSE